MNYTFYCHDILITIGCKSVARTLMKPTACVKVFVFHCKLLRTISLFHRAFYITMSHLYQLMHLFWVILKSLKTLLLKTILHVSIFQDHHQGFFHSLPRWAASIQLLKCLNIYKNGNVDKNGSIVMWQHMFVFLWCVQRWGVSCHITILPFLSTLPYL